MCELCIAEDVLPRRRFLRLAATSAVALAAGAAFDAQVVEAKPKTTATKTAAKSKITAVAAPSIVTRAEWGADESIRDSHIVGWAPFRKIVVHHTASPNFVKDPAATVRYGYKLHVVDRGFTDIGYNFLIGPDGEIFEGRRARKYGKGELHNGEDGAGNAIIGGHTKGRNAGTCGIALIGNFMKTSPSSAAIESLIHLAAWEAQRHKIDPLGSDEFIATDATKLTFFNIVGHRGIGSTLCPGNRMAASMPWLRSQIAERVGSFPARKSDMRRLAWILDKNA
jgi:N-acetylmuramoyl-L-alanine amidase